MAILQGLLALVFRSAGKILNTAFGWATSMLFGKVPEDRQIYLSVVAFGSVAWIVAVLGTLFPSVATFLLAFVPLPDWVEDGWVRLAMLIAAVIIPLVVGGVLISMMDKEDRPKTMAAKAKAVLKGYPYTVGLALTLILMTVLAPIMKVRTIVKRWSDEHVPVVIEPENYREVVRDVRQALGRGGIPTRPQQASWMLRLPTKILTSLAGGAVENLVADELTELKAKNLEVLLHPSDLIIRGAKLDAAHARAVLTEQLTFTKAYLTWTKEANELEDRLRQIWCDSRDDSLPAGALGPIAIQQLQDVERDLRQAKLPYDEWEVLYREKLLVERGLLQVAAGVTAKPLDLTEARPEELSLANSAVAREGRARRLATAREPIPVMIAVAILGTVADVVHRLRNGRAAA